MVDGSMLWGTLGSLSKVGLAYVSEFIGAEGVELSRQEWGEHAPLASDYSFDAVPGRVYRLRQLTSVVPSAMHMDSDRQAVRLVGRARHAGWEAIREASRRAWAEIWRGRIRIIGAEPRWQELADAAMFYLNSSVHPASPSSTSIFGLAQWNDYHYYYGPRHVGRRHLRRTAADPPAA